MCRIHFTDDAVSIQMSHFRMRTFIRTLNLELLTPSEWHPTNPKEDMEGEFLFK